MRSHCGFRRVVNLVEYLNEVLGLGLTHIPTRNTIENWVLKSGYSIYKEPWGMDSDASYAQIIDESLLIGGEKVMLSLGVNSTKTTQDALCRQDIRVLNICSGSHFDSQSIKEMMTQTALKVGKPPLYVISDNDSKLTKAIRKAGYIHIPDVGHTMALLVKRIYKDEADFKSLTKAIADTKRYAVLRDESYLLPPRQRTISRFMNLSTTIEWAQKMEHVFDSFNPQEKHTYGFINQHKVVIEELKSIFDYINYKILAPVKLNGISKEKIDLLLKELKRNLWQNTPRINLFINSLRAYLLELKTKLPSDALWNASSDVIESLFGFYKLRKSPNPLNGITSYVLLLPLLGRISKTKKPSEIDFKKALETVKGRDITNWAKMNLIQNKTIRRRNKLAG